MLVRNNTVCPVCGRMGTGTLVINKWIPDVSLKGSTSLFHRQIHRGLHVVVGCTNCSVYKGLCWSMPVIRAFLEDLCLTSPPSHPTKRTSRWKPGVSYTWRTYQRLVRSVVEFHELYDFLRIAMESKPSLKNIAGDLSDCMPDVTITSYWTWCMSKQDGDTLSIPPCVPYRDCEGRYSSSGNWKNDVWMSFSTGVVRDGQA